MKVHLLFHDKDADPTQPLPPLSEALVRDLGLDDLLDGMADGDTFLRQVARDTVLRPLADVESIRYRQDVLDDCLQHPDSVLALYRIALSALESTKKVRGWYLSDYPRGILNHAIELLEVLISDLRNLRQLADRDADQFTSEGFRALFAVVERDLPDTYFELLSEHLRRLKFPTGVFLTAELGDSCKGTNYVLRKARTIKLGWRDLLKIGERSEYTIRIPERDEAGAKALSDLRDRGLNLVADAAAQSTDHILSFFTMLRWELGFYVGCLNIHKELTRRSLALCRADPRPPGETALTTRGLYDLTLGLRLEESVVDNDVSANGRSLIMITGANQGGKSTLLRAIGLAQLMMQSGMLTPALEYRSSVACGLYTHFKREEDAGMESGKFTEELDRMSQIVDLLTPNSLVLLNESVASTNEREGSRIARHIIDGLRDSGIRLVFVNHMFDLAQGLEGADGVLFLRPERLPGGQRTFRIIEGGPLPTSHGRDIYERVFARAAG